jgi:hypothetical protein
VPIEHAPVVGKDCKAYLNGGTRAAPTWQEIKNAINVSANMGKGEADASARFSGWKLTKGALKELEISFTYRYKRGTDAIFDTLVSAYLEDTPIEVAILDEEITVAGAQGPRAFCEVFSMNLTQELENTSEYEFTLKPTYHEEGGGLVEPEWYEV